MTYQEILNHIYSLGRFGIRPGLDRITALLQALDNPQSTFKSVHVAGTNGKGSTSCFMASMLAEGGYRVGLFTSPHLISFTERIRINGMEIFEEDVVRLGQRVLSAAPAETTFFEMVTAMACLHFAEQKVDLAVMEAGMGGSFDATNALDGILSVITPISIDHSEYLGSSIAAIAREKAGIIKAGRPVVISSQEPDARGELEMRCRELDSPLYCCGRDFDAEWLENGLSYKGGAISLAGLRPGLCGSYQKFNAAVALAAVEALGQAGFSMAMTAMSAGIEVAKWPGRMEMLNTSPRILLDGAHNPAGSAALAGALSEIPRRRLLLIVGVMGDKDLGGILGPILPFADEVFAVAPLLPRALPAAELAEFCRRQGLMAHDAGSVTAGLAAARSRAGADDLILVCGSLFTVGEARATLFSRQYEPFRG
ncbi:folylpolyglutamate synthetase [Geotalea daltonii FRC-32]|uniref:Dihydrofolate synthase/folylpolyglutamate synthase n=1 Tax=Geotalea daltonii (strain DSM 22248 / JCM 15807 / FRC-32) TaxID=316067 RepID=B9M7D7_GEODF|nr:folylpolyglutamate synthase/dihydrofolate synthase family protein [Geotalea daltonii]ACM20225.1 folylpolyglutamate synthetase [Geotalea daltonii FRC-32]